MTRPHYIHSDLFVYLTAFPKLSKDVRSATEVAEKTYIAMMQDLEEISGGKLVVPTYNYTFSETNLFDVRNDVSEIGQFSELFRNQYIHSRSYVPMFSNCANFDHFLHNTTKYKVDPFGETSDFQSLVNADGNIVTFGSSFAPTFIMYIEKQFENGPLYRYDKTFSGTIIDQENVSHSVELLNHVRPQQIEILYDLDKIETELEEQTILTRHILRDKFSYSLCNAVGFLEHMLKKLAGNPLYFLTKRTAEQLHETGILRKGRVSIEDFE